MTAIWGAIGTGGRPWTSADLDGVARALAPFGPDGRGDWSGTAGSCGVAIGAALRRRTPEDASESLPRRSADDSVVVAGDLRVDNRAELAVALDLTDDRTTPDSAFWLAGYERWGESVLDRVVGDFAVAIVDRRRGGVLLARDPVGARPLALSVGRETVAFASMPLALTALTGIGHDLDVVHAAEILALAYSSQRTFVEGVEWLPPGTLAWIDARGTRRRTWWAPDPHVFVDATPGEHAGRLKDAFDGAVTARLRSAGAVAAGVSGGIDSSSVAATAADLLAPDPLRTYTSAPPPNWSGGPPRPGWDVDESALVRVLAAAHPNMAPSIVHVDLDAPVLGLQESMWELGAGPTRNPCNLLWMYALRKRAAADGATTLLHADFGNFFFSADGPGWLAELLRSGRVAAFRREAAAWRRATGESRLEIARRHVMPELLPVGIARMIRRSLGRQRAVDEWLEASALRRDVAAALPLEQLLPNLDESRSDRRSLALSVRPHYAGQADVAAALGAVTGIEARDPTADRRVIEVAMAQPESARRHDGVTRAVARAAMKGRVPEAILERTRRGEQLPDWLDVLTRVRSEVESEVDAISSHAASRELIDVGRLRGLVARWPDTTRWADHDVVRDYRLVLLRSVVVARYLRWFEDHAKAARPVGRAAS